jgi:hypothetical protein
MFYSDNFYYQYFALNSIEQGDSLKYLSEVIHLVKSGISYIPYFAIDKIPQSAWAADSSQISLLQHFGAADFELKNSMLSKMANVTMVADALDVLVSEMPRLTESQLLKAISIVERNEARLTTHARSQLKRWTDHGDKRISRTVQSILGKSKTK